MANRARYRFTVKETGTGQPYLTAEPLDGDLTILGGGWLTLDFKPGITYAEVQGIAEMLNDRETSIAYNR